MCSRTRARTQKNAKQPTASPAAAAAAAATDAAAPDSPVLLGDHAPASKPPPPPPVLNQCELTWLNNGKRCGKCWDPIVPGPYPMGPIKRHPARGARRLDCGCMFHGDCEFSKTDAHGDLVCILCGTEDPVDVTGQPILQKRTTDDDDDEEDKGKDEDEYDCDSEDKDESESDGSRNCMDDDATYEPSSTSNDKDESDDDDDNERNSADGPSVHSNDPSVTQEKEKAAAEIALEEEEEEVVEECDVVSVDGRAPFQSPRARLSPPAAAPSAAVATPPPLGLRTPPTRRRVTEPPAVDIHAHADREAATMTRRILERGKRNVDQLKKALAAPRTGPRAATGAAASAAAASAAAAAPEASSPQSPALGDDTAAVADTADATKEHNDDDDDDESAAKVKTRSKTSVCLRETRPFEKQDDPLEDIKRMPSKCSACDEKLVVDVDCIRRLPCGCAFHDRCGAAMRAAPGDQQNCCVNCREPISSAYEMCGHIGPLGGKARADLVQCPSNICHACPDAINAWDVAVTPDDCAHTFHLECLLDALVGVGDFSRKCPAQGCVASARTYRIWMPSAQVQEQAKIHFRDDERKRKHEYERTIARDCKCTVHRVLRRHERAYTKMKRRIRSLKHLVRDNATAKRARKA